ncbi:MULTISPECIES: hypothetical protein [Mycobacteroides]|jgi:hypothetical protein|nr:MULTISPECIES: hypothetical protein [Mycobacteroides]
MLENTSTTVCSAFESQNEVLVRLVGTLMTMGVDFEIHQTAA